MTGFQRGDVILTLGGRAFYLRLTLGALAEICARFETRDPLALAQVLRSPDIERMTLILIALIRPAHGNIESELILAHGHKPAAMTAIADCFDAAFNLESPS